MKYLVTKIICTVLLSFEALALYAQDTMIRRVQKEHGQTSPVIIWLFIAVIPVLFLIFAVTKGKKARREVVNDADKEERVVRDTLPKQ